MNYNFMILIALPGLLSWSSHFKAKRLREKGDIHEARHLELLEAIYLAVVIVICAISGLPEWSK